MLGAFLGDIVGSKYEFNNIRTKEFPLFSNNCFMTDDSIMTLAVVEILENRYQYDKDKIIDTFKKWGRAYPNRGYGGRFSRWLFSDDRESYRSYGNGAAMRISPVGYYARNEQEVKEFSKAITEVTHSHPEGLKGAEVVAMCVYYARIGKSKEFIRKYVEKYYSLDFDYEDLRKNYWFNETCQDSVPQAIYCFLISDSLEDCARTTISIGGDCDTTAAISCAIADAYYKNMTQKIVNQIMMYLPKRKDGCNPLQTIRDLVEKAIGDDSMSENIFGDTKFIVELRKYNNKITAGWYFSRSYSALASSFIYYTFDNFFQPEVGDLSVQEVLTYEDINEYVDELSSWLEYEGECYEVLQILRPHINKFLDCDNKEDFRKFLELYTSQLQRFDENLEFKFFDSREEAWEFLKDNFDAGNELYQEVFCRVYEKIDEE